MQWMNWKTVRHVFALVVLAAVPGWGQYAAPNSAGVAMGHVHLYVPDLDVQKAFWKQLGGRPVVEEKQRARIEFPGVYITLRKDTFTGGSVGSVVNHFGFHVKNINEWMPKWKAAGLEIDAGTEPKKNNPGSVFLLAPDGVKVEIIEDPSISTPIAMHHVHLFVPDPAAAQSWYVKNFGAAAGKRNRFLTANLPGAELTFTPAEVAQAPTKGRSLDHIGFEVVHIEDFVKKLGTAGIHAEAGVHPSSNEPSTKVAHITDPWGTRIELTSH